ncbi:hypothetical protein [Moraxella lincolnii]|nr:hypothetical protein [Moraxella lincolnii]
MAVTKTMTITAITIMADKGRQSNKKKATCQLYSDWKPTNNPD